MPNVYSVYARIICVRCSIYNLKERIGENDIDKEKR